MTADRILSCGHPPSPHSASSTGTAWTDEDKEICWGCSDEHSRDRMRKGLPCIAYLSSDSKTLQTWNGAPLASVTAMTSSRAGFGRTTRYHYRATGEGHNWYGTCQGPGMYTSMRALKAK